MFPLQTAVQTFGSASARPEFPLFGASSAPLNLAALESASSPSTSLAPFFRFAFLLTGDATIAGDVLIGALTELQTRRGELRSRGKCHAALARAIRHHCLERPLVEAMEPASSSVAEDCGADAAGCAGAGADAVARRICALAEPERSAVALFYLNLCVPDEIAETLDLSLEQLSEALRCGREHLQQFAHLSGTAESAG